MNKTQKEALSSNIKANQSRKNSTLVHSKSVQERVQNHTKFQRDGISSERIALQREILGYKDLATTTIGSFPQTPEIRKARSDFKNSLISKDKYEKEIKNYIDECVAFQEECGLEILVCRKRN
jgi:5-methyltetrahydropteroyltriglutamate--homocysteine methyltransferase